MSNEMEPTQEVVKRKRGRKKKVDDSTTSNPTEEPDVAEEKPKSRRGRKNKNVVNTYATGTSHSNVSDDENIIVQLNVKNIENPHILSESVAEDAPFAYDANINHFASVPMNILNSKEDEMNDNNDIEYDFTPRVVELLKDFEMKSKISEWPSNTSICCYWCCHSFSTVPFGIPVKYYQDKFHVFGCFCSLECATAYNFNFQESTDEMWERYNLINLLSRKLGYKTCIKPAPSRLSLKMFGGHIDIDEFRSFTNTKKVLSINFPPMTTLTQQIEEINECDINSEYRYIPIDHERINKYKEKLTLKRTKPVTNFKHTLDHMMNLKIQV